MHLKDKEQITDTVIRISDYLYSFNCRYRESAPPEWNPVLLFPHSMELVDPAMTNPDQSSKFHSGGDTWKPWSEWGKSPDRECLISVIKIEMDSLKTIKSPKREFITRETKSESEQIIGLFDFDRRIYTRLLITDIPGLTRLTYMGNREQLEKDQSLNMPTILNSDTLLARVHGMIFDYTLHQPCNDLIFYIWKAFQFKPHFSELFNRYEEK